jgi:hypothetical protein
MTYNNDKAEKEIKNKVFAEYKKIKVKPGKCRYNYRCQMNAVHEASKKGDKKIAMCIYLDDNYPVIHFINYKKGKFTDNTLGQWATLNEYYFVKWIHEDDFWNVNNIFISYRKELRKSLSWWVRLTSNYNI